MLYVSSACIKKKRIEDVICQYVENGIYNIELSGGTNYYEDIETDLQMLKRSYRLNYACHAYFPPPKEPFVVNLAACNDKIYKRSIEHYVRCIEMLKRLECNVLSVHAGFLVEIGTEEIGKKLNDRIIYDESEAYERFCTAYSYIAKLCTDNNITLFLENNVLSAENYQQFGNRNYMMMTDWDSIVRMKKRMEFNLLLDLGHLHVSAQTLGLNYHEECAELKPYVKWIHVSENHGISDEHKPLKVNSVILNELQKIYCPETNITLETVGDITDILNSIAVIEKHVWRN